MEPPGNVSSIGLVPRLPRGGGKNSAANPKGGPKGRHNPTGTGGTVEADPRKPRKIKLSRTYCRSAIGWAKTSVERHGLRKNVVPAGIQCSISATDTVPEVMRILIHGQGSLAT